MNRSKRRGTQWERELADALRSYGYAAAERRALDGKGDRGDIAGIPGTVIECKHTGWDEIAAELDEAIAEAVNDRALWTFVAKRRKRKAALDGYAVMTIEQALSLIEAARYAPDPPATPSPHARRDASSTPAS